jgi:sporulation protein YlmC with PRC-barrel domain
MKQHHRITSKEKALENTLDVKKLLGLRVITRSGFVLGKVKQIRINEPKVKIEGIVVSRGFFKKPVYLGLSYIRKVSSESFILKIDPVILFRGRKIIDSRGKKFGKIKRVVRKENSNEIHEFRVFKILKRLFT